MKKFALALLGAIALAACSGPEDVLETMGDISVPDQLSGCVSRDDDGSCAKAVCVADEEDDCKDFVKACEKHDHIADVRNGHDTCERAASPESMLLWGTSVNPSHSHIRWIHSYRCNRAGYA